MKNHYTAVKGNEVDCFGEKRMLYGIGYVVNGEVVQAEPCISDSLEDMERLAKLCTELELSPVHMAEIALDWHPENIPFV